MAVILKVVIKDRCVFKKWLRWIVIGQYHVQSSFGANKCKISEFSQVKTWKLVKLVDQSNKTSEPIEPYAPGKASEVSDSINNNQGTIELAVAGNYRSDPERTLQRQKRLLGRRYGVSIRQKQCDRKNIASGRTNLSDDEGNKLKSYSK